MVTTATPNHALQRTPSFGVQLPSAAVVRPAQSRAVRPAMKPGTARAFALRRRAHSRVPGPESLSLGSLGVATRVVFNDTFLPDLSNFMAASTYPFVAFRSGSRCPAPQSVRSVAVQS